MDFHEIIHAWENNALPTDLAALARVVYELEIVIENSDKWLDRSRTVDLMVYYDHLSHICRLVVVDVEANILGGVDEMLFVEGGVEK